MLGAATPSSPATLPPIDAQWDIFLGKFSSFIQYNSSTATAERFVRLAYLWLFSQSRPDTNGNVFVINILNKILASKTLVLFLQTLKTLTADDKQYSGLISRIGELFTCLDENGRKTAGLQIMGFIEELEAEKRRQAEQLEVIKNLPPFAQQVARALDATGSDPKATLKSGASHDNAPNTTPGEPEKDRFQIMIAGYRVDVSNIIYTFVKDKITDASEIEALNALFRVPSKEEGVIGNLEDYHRDIIRSRFIQNPRDTSSIYARLIKYDDLVVTIINSLTTKHPHLNFSNEDKASIKKQIENKIMALVGGYRASHL